MSEIHVQEIASMSLDAQQLGGIDMYVKVLMKQDFERLPSKVNFKIYFWKAIDPYYMQGTMDLQHRYSLLLAALTTGQ